MAKKTTTKRKSRKKSGAAVAVEAVVHQDKRVNIPTEELRDFVAHDEKQPSVATYARNPDLDPQLVWTGKDEQDSNSLEIPAVPIYIQEKIHPQAIIDDFRGLSPNHGDELGQLDLFADFNGLPDEFADRVDFYQHEGNWSNRLILGDSLLVLTSLAEKEGLKGRVQTVFLDPPYGIRFGSNWQVSTRKRAVRDGQAGDLTRQPEQIKAFRDTWQLGIHSYLSYLRDRFVVSRELLTDSGSIFVQIGDENVHLVRSLLDEVFGSDNFVALIPFTKGAAGLSAAKRLSSRLDYLLWYAKDSEQTKYRQLYTKRTDLTAAGFTWVELPDGLRRRLTREERQGTAPLPDGARLFGDVDLTKPGPGAKYSVEFQGKEFDSGKRWWGTPKESMQRIIRSGKVLQVGKKLRIARYADDFPVQQIDNLWSGFAGQKDPVYVVQTNVEIAKRCILMTSDPGDLVVDPTCGSGTTAYVAEQWGRRWITIDTSRVAVTLTRTRLMAARFPYYLLLDSTEGLAKDAEVAGRPTPTSTIRPSGDVRKGFVLQRVPHVTLKAIGNNEQIDEIDARWRDTLDPLLERINAATGNQWKEWDVPRIATDDEGQSEWPPETQTLLEEWWSARCARQAEIDTSIAQHSDTEILYDQPFEDRSRVRVTGPFTVESLSPHRTIVPPDRPVDDHDTEAAAGHGADDFTAMILENLRQAGVQNTFRGERLTFDRLEPFAGQWIHGEGEYTDGDGNTKRIAVSVGPEHGTVSPQLVKEAAKEAVQGVGFDILTVCGFAFDPHVTEEAQRYGSLVVLPTKMNPDLAMGDLLKKTGSGNLFMVFGEPDVEIEVADDQVTVEVRGLDVYDPTTGEIRSSSTDDIACWFIDTNYNGESFFVRHAYFTGADEPYERLAKALNAEIDEQAWAALYSTISRPFARPTSGKIAIKLINHFGDEVLKAYTID